VRIVGGIAQIIVRQKVFQRLSGVLPQFENVPIYGQRPNIGAVAKARLDDFFGEFRSRFQAEGRQFAIVRFPFLDGDRSVVSLHHRPVGESDGGIDRDVGEQLSADAIENPSPGGFAI